MGSNKQKSPTLPGFGAVFLLHFAAPLVVVAAHHSLLTDRRVDAADEMPPRKKSKIKVSKHSCRHQLVVYLYLTLPWRGHTVLDPGKHCIAINPVCGSVVVTCIDHASLV